MPDSRRFYVKRGERAVLAFTLTYTIGFSIWFLLSGNYEFIVYIITMIMLISLVVANFRKVEFPIFMLWLLAFLGLTHMAGGGIIVGKSVLYSYKVVQIAGSGDLALLKYDQIIHAFGAGVTTWVLWHLLVLNYPILRNTWTVYIYSALAAVGLGAMNEVIEFSAVLIVQETNVGGYFNTALDLVFNSLGAIGAMILIWVSERKQKSS
jgi:putative membrane protein